MLKAKFREAAKRLHTDTGGSDEAFIAMKAAYDALCEESATGVFTDGPELQATEEGTPLTSLGCGLGPMKNGKPCATCGGAGYREEKSYGTIWTPALPCAMCQIARSTWGCRRCGDKGYQHRQVNIKRYKVCAPCQGAGEIELLNPVLPKGLLFTFLKKGNQ